MDEANPAPQPALTTGEQRRIWIIAAVIGIPLGIAALVLLALLHDASHYIWFEAPEQLGLGTGAPPWWYVILVPALGGLVAALLMRRAGVVPTGKLALEAVSMRAWPWLVAAAFVTIGCGFVIGPEAPLLVTGIALASLAARLGGITTQAGTTVVITAGAFTVLSTLLVSPLTTLVLMLEMVAALGTVPAQRLVPLLLPGMLAGALGLAVYAGVNEWTGINPPTMAIPDLPEYSTIRVTDIVWSIPVALAAALVIEAIQHTATHVRSLVARAPIAATCVLGVLVGSCAVAYRALADRPIDEVLFSGQESLPDYVGISSAGVLLLIVAFKGIAYTLSTAGRLEGGPIFPAIAIGGALGTAAALVLPGAAVLPMVATGIAASTASLQRLPVFGFTFAVILLGAGAALETTLFCMIGALIGGVIASQLGERIGMRRREVAA